jgi:hypothetical protein
VDEDVDEVIAAKTLQAHPMATPDEVDDAVDPEPVVPGRTTPGTDGSGA